MRRIVGKCSWKSIFCFAVSAFMLAASIVTFREARFITTATYRHFDRLLSDDRSPTNQSECATLPNTYMLWLR
uniref:Uncharacterized protein n=1 Tax=Ciona savignyi TaxID=51511 RepID=H2YGE8_CIOSA